jgi:hypothetical protein
VEAGTRKEAALVPPESSATRWDGPDKNEANRDSSVDGEDHGGLRGQGNAEVCKRSGFGACGNDINGSVAGVAIPVWLGQRQLFVHAASTQRREHREAGMRQGVRFDGAQNVA